VKSDGLIGVCALQQWVGLRVPFARPALNKTWQVARKLLNQLPIVGCVHLQPKILFLLLQGDTSMTPEKQ